MSKGCLIPAVLGGGLLLLLVLLAATGVGSYNSLVTSRNRAQEHWSKVEDQYRRRADLVPNLVKTVQGSADFEKSTLTEVTQARASVGRAQLPPPGQLPTDPAQLRAYIDAQNSLGGALSRLLVVSEQYPQLRASDAFRDLQSQLEGTENRISVARSDYIATANAYNTRLQQFPTNVLGNVFSFQPAALFEATPEERRAPPVDFDFGTKPNR